MKGIFSSLVDFFEKYYQFNKNSSVKHGNNVCICKSVVAFCLILTFILSGCIAKKTVESTDLSTNAVLESTTQATSYVFYTSPNQTTETDTEITSSIKNISEISTAKKNTVRATLKPKVSITSANFISTKVSTTKKVTNRTTSAATIPSATAVRTTANPLTSPRPSVTVKASTTAVHTTADLPSTTTHQTTTALSTTTKPSTTQSTTTTAPIEKPVYIKIDSRKIFFECTESEITGVMGEPTEVITEETTSGSTVHHLVYAQNYAELMIFQIWDNELYGFYTFKRDAVITNDESSYSLGTGGDDFIGKTHIRIYGDKIGGKNFAIHAQYDLFGTYISSPENVYAHEKLNFHATNALRAINNVAPLEYCSEASDCARAHANDMASRNYFDHVSPEGLRPSDRMRNSGISFHCCGENIDCGYSDAFYMAYGWYNSQGHRNNILNPDFTRLGVGIATSENADYDTYGCQNFYA